MLAVTYLWILCVNKIKRRFKKAYIFWRRRSKNVLEAFPVFMGERASYIYDMRRIYRILPRNLRIRFFIIMMLTLLQAVVESSFIFIISMFTRSVASPDSLRSRRIYKLIIPYLPEYINFRLNGDKTLITTMCLLVVLFVVLKNVIICLSSYQTSLFSEKVGLFVTQEAYARYLAEPYLWHVSGKSKDMINRIDRCPQLTSLITSIMRMFSNLLCAFVMFGVLFATKPELLVCIISIFFIVCVSTYTMLRTKIDHTGIEVARISTEQSWAIRMVTRGVREIIIYQKQRTFLNNITQNIKKLTPHRVFLSFSGQIPGWLLEVSGFMIIFGAMVYMVGAGIPMPEVLSTMSMLLITAWRVLPMVSRSMGLAIHIRGIRSRAISCLELLEGFTKCFSVPQIDYNFNTSESIILDGVNFRYSQNSSDVLQNISLSISCGEFVGLIGKSGAGKSTLGMILAGLFEVSSGVMLVGKQALTSELMDSYRRSVGYVPQSPLLLPGSIADNIALSHWGEKYNKEKLNNMCSLAAMDFIISGAKSLNFVVGENGSGLSGGEAQRVSIARAMYTNPKIIIFDEATSSLDQQSESHIAEAMQLLRGEVTLIVIAHRLATIKNCDRVVWLENGTIKMVGEPNVVLSEYTGEK